MIRRNTIQCSLVLEAVRKLHCHASADEIYDEIIIEHPNVSRATVYRNLNRLAETGEILKIENPDGPDRFDHLRYQHYHVKCTKCGRISDVDMDYMANLEKAVRDSHGFEFTGHNIMFQGICPDCQTLV